MSLFHIRQAAGKGLGVFAAQQIHPGQRILSDRALLTISASNADIVSQAALLTQAGLTALLDLSQNSSKSGALSWLESIWRSKSAPMSTRHNHTILNIFRNNNFNIGDEVRALFPQVARLNHSCVPNAQGNFNSALKKFTVHATSAIQPGEEVTISYLDDQLALRVARQTKLENDYGFICGCKACDQASPDSSARESRRIQVLQQLETYSQSTPRDDNQELELFLALLETLEKENIRGREVATMYMAAARKALSIGLQDSARELALQGLQCEQEAVGNDSPFFEATKKEAEGLGLKL